MTRDELRLLTYNANMELPARGLVVYTWGNVSQFDIATGAMAIKPSGVPYESLSSQDIVVMDLDANILEGDKNPSSDTDTHLALYRVWRGQIGGIVHVHSTYATAFAQAQLPIPCYGTTHADYFYGQIPVTVPLKPPAVEAAYEKATGDAIVELFKRENLNPLHVPGVLVHGHGPFAFGKDAAQAVHNAVVLEQIAYMAYLTRTLTPQPTPLPAHILDKHFLRKHGPNAYYGQKE